MTDKERLALIRRIERTLAKTGQGHIQWVKEGKPPTHWKRALADLNRLERSLKDPVPALGPVWVGGKSILEHDLTHATSGLVLYPAFDDAFNQGRVIIAPEAMTVTRMSTSRPGLAFFAAGRSKIDYWFGHLDRTHPAGTKFRKGDAVGKVAANNIGGGPHVHVGINVERLLGPGRQLAHHTNYTHGAPLIGVQLRKALS